MHAGRQIYIDCPNDVEGENFASMKSELQVVAGCRLLQVVNLIPVSNLVRDFSVNHIPNKFSYFIGFLTIHSFNWTPSAMLECSTSITKNCSQLLVFYS